MLPRLALVKSEESNDVGYGELIKQLRDWQDIPDPTHVVAALATAVTAVESGTEPLWLLLVAPPSSGKTETIRILDAVAAENLDEVTVGGLLTWTKRGKTPEPAGVLTRVRHGLVTFGDLSTLLATSDKGGRDQVFAMLRRVYDGQVSRDIAAPSGATVPGPLSWSGRLNIVGAVTGAIDAYSVHADALGSRWLYCRLPERTTEAKRRAAGMGRRGGLDQHRAKARALAAEVVAAARARLESVVVAGAVAEAIEDAALVTCWGRASVPRSSYGRREIDGPVTVEEPMRVIHQLTALARGLLALGLSDLDTTAVCSRVALDSMPAARCSA
ncbi:MAG: hypothetical protein LC799_35500, partial [Actinobacteria bacterium]|nr:hypothetical protein [Actinomycetota bacterium]